MSSLYQVSLVFMALDQGGYMKYVDSRRRANHESKAIITKLVDMFYERNDRTFSRYLSGSRDVIEIFPFMKMIMHFVVKCLMMRSKISLIDPLRGTRVQD